MALLLSYNTLVVCCRTTLTNNQRFIYRFIRDWGNFGLDALGGQRGEGGQDGLGCQWPLIRAVIDHWSLRVVGWSGRSRLSRRSGGGQGSQCGQGSQGGQWGQGGQVGWVHQIRLVGPIKFATQLSILIYSLDLHNSTTIVNIGKLSNQGRHCLLSRILGPEKATFIRLIYIFINNSIW